MGILLDMCGELLIAIKIGDRWLVFDFVVLDKTNFNVFIGMNLVKILVVNLCSKGVT